MGIVVVETYSKDQPMSTILSSKIGHVHSIFAS